MRIVSAVGLVVFTSYVASAQSTANPASFEVASVKPAPPPADGRLMIQMGGDAGRIDYKNVSLRDLLRNAYKVKDHQITGPDWLASERYNVVAKLPPDATKDQVPAMLQTLLVDRFKLTLHKEQKVLPAYSMVVAKGGPKLHPAEAEGGVRLMMGPRGRHMTGVVTMQSLSDALSNFMDRPVIDMTGIKGNYDVDIEWTGDEGGQRMRMGMPMRGPGGPEGGPHGGDGEAKLHEENTDAPSIFTSLQEKLGLKLDPRKEPVDILIIDHAEKVPTDN